MFNFLKSYFRKFFQILLLLSLLVLFFIFLKQIDLQQFLRSLQSANFSILLAAFFCSFFMLPLKNAQLRFYLKKDYRSSWLTLFQTTAVWQMVMNFFPLGGADAIAVYLFHYKLEVAKIESVSMMTLEKLADGISLLAVFLFLAIVSDIPEWMKNGVYTLTILILFFLVSTVFIAHRFRNLELKFADQQKGKIRKLLYHFSRWITHLHLLRDYRRGISVFLLAIAVKIVEGITLYLVQKSLGIELPYWVPFLSIAALNISLSVPVMPGNFGVFEMTVCFIYRYLGIDLGSALSMGILYHLIYTSFPVLIGYPISLKWGFKFKSFSSLKEDQSSESFAG